MFKHITWHSSAIEKSDRQKIVAQKSFVICFTGLSGSGKSTVSAAVEQALYKRGYLAYRLDGDNIRHGLNSNLGFSPEDRKENIRRIGEVSKLFVDSGVIVLTAFISPYQSDRDFIRGLVAPDEFVEIYVECSLAACEQRDVKGLYAKARAGEIKDFTGVNAPYEPPIHPELIVNTETQTVDQSLEQIMDMLHAKGYLTKG